MIVLTVGKKYIDIDGYASAIAYRELLKMRKIDAKFVSNAVLNYSINERFKKMPYGIDEYQIKTNDRFIILDLSNKLYFPKFVNENKIIEIIDHHFGFEDYWNNKLRSNAIIENIGSVATIIIEKYEQYGLLNKIDLNIAEMLMAAILDNTLNFMADITKERDKIAYKKLEKITGKYNYALTYFSECQEYIENHLQEAIQNDIKIQKINDEIPEVFGQLTIWNMSKILTNKNIIKQVMDSYGNMWILNIISLKDNTSYILYSNDKVKNKLLVKKPAMLRKEIMKLVNINNKSD